MKNDSNDPIETEQHPPTRSDSSSSVTPGDTLVAPESDVSRGSGPGQLPKAPSLYSTARALHALELALIESGGELSQELEDAIAAELIVKEKKVDAYDAILKRCVALNTEYSTKADMLYAVATSANKLAKRLKDNLKTAMQILDASELRGNNVRFKLSGGKYKVVIEDASLIPNQFFKTVTTETPDLEMIAAALEAFEDVPGCRLEKVQTLRTYAATRETK